MKKILIPVVLLALLLGGLVFWKTQSGEGESSVLKLYGNVEIRETRLAFNGSEHIAEVLVEEGDRVAKGQPLARLHTELLEAQLAAAKAAAEAQAQVLKKLEGGTRPETIRKVEAELAAAIAKEKAAQASYERIRTLEKKKLAAADAVEQAKAQADSARAQVDAVRHSLKLLKLGAQKEDIAAARAQLVAKQAAVALAEQRLADATLYAPDTGIVRNRILQPGDMAFPQTPVLTMAFTSPVWVRAYVPEEALGRVKPGMSAKIHTDSYPDKAYDGWVGYISPTAEFTPKSVQTEALRTRLVYSMRVYACNPEGELRLGMPATVELDLEAPAPTGDAQDAATRCGG